MLEMERLSELKGKFWTDLEELKDEIYNMGFGISEYHHEAFYVYSSDEDYEDVEWIIWLMRAGTTIAVERVEEH